MKCPEEDSKSTDLRAAALKSLIEHARRISREREAQRLFEATMVFAQAPEGRLPLPAYTPFIGEAYFAPRLEGARVLILGLSQNLRPAHPWATEWARDWTKGDGNIALDRQNDEFRKSGQISMNPFDTGHLAIIAAFARGLLRKRPASAEDRIHCEVAATNISKWSFRSESGTTTRDDEECLAWCVKHILRVELELLAPDALICTGKLGADAVLGDSQIRREHRILKVAFPSATVLNTRYGGPLTSGLPSHEEMLSMLSEHDRAYRLYTGHTPEEVLQKHPLYFAEMLDSMRKQF